MNEIPIGFGDVQRIDARETCGIVHQAVDAPGVRVDRVEKSFYLGGALQICFEERRVSAFRRGGECVGFGRVVMYRNASALPRHADRDVSADAFGGAGDQNYTALEGRHVSIVACGAGWHPAWALVRPAYQAGRMPSCPTHSSSDKLDSQSI